MALSRADAAVLGTWVGDNAVTADETSFDERVDRLGNVYAAALEWLMARRAQVSTSADELTAGPDKAKFLKTADRLTDQINRLAAFIAASDSITLTGAAADLLESTEGASAPATEVVSTLGPNPRRG